VTTIDQRIEAFHKLGELFYDISSKKENSKYKKWITVFNKKINEAYQYNKWFTTENCLLSFKNWSKELTTLKLSKWLNNYELKNCSKKTIVIIMAGNIPLVGFHDFICAKILNYKCLIKMSSDDKILLPIVIDFLDFILPGFKKNIEFTNKPLKKFDGVIATGSNSSFKYFEYYFKKYPKILRKTRHSIAVLDGNESKENLIDLGNDIFNYFGMGCRSVSKIFVPKNYNFDLLFESLFEFKEVIKNNRYANNYDYNKAIYLMGEKKITENGFLILKKDKNLGSPIACLFYDTYNSIKEIEKYIDNNSEYLQCIVGNFKLSNSIPLGSSQKPKIYDYADKIDTLNFLLKM